MRKKEFDYYTIEPDPSGGVNVYGHGTYERSSVLAGQARRACLDCFDTQEEAEVKYPNAQILDHNTKTHYDPMPINAPDWFDPAAAGEVWGEDDY